MIFNVIDKQKQKLYFDEHLLLVLSDIVDISPGFWFLGVERSVYSMCEKSGVFKATSQKIWKSGLN